MPSDEFFGVSLEDCRQIVRMPLEELSQEQRRILESDRFIGLIASLASEVKPSNVDLLERISEVSTSRINQIGNPEHVSAKNRRRLVFYSFVRDEVRAQLSKIDS